MRDKYFEMKTKSRFRKVEYFFD